MNKFWKVTVQLDDERPQDTMVFVMEWDATPRGIMRSYARRFPEYFSLDVAPCDAWGRKWPQQYEFCPTCGQPLENDEPCDHARKTDHYCITAGGTP